MQKLRIATEPVVEAVLRRATSGIFQRASARAGITGVAGVEEVGLLDCLGERPIGGQRVARLEAVEAHRTPDGTWFGTKTTVPHRAPNGQMHALRDSARSS